jgi:integrase
VVTFYQANRYGMQQEPVFVSFFLNASSPRLDGTCLIKMTIYQNPHKKRYSTKFHLSREDWDKLNAPKLRDENLKELQRKLAVLKNSAEKVIEKIAPFSFVAFEEAFIGKRPKKSENASGVKARALHSKMLSDWFDDTISTLEVNEQLGAASLYRTVRNSINEFRKNLFIHDITPAFLISYEEQLKSEEKSLATIGIYMRHLRAVINGAIEAKVISENDYPFKEYKIPTGQNVKKALKNSDVEKILTYQPKTVEHEKALDYWIFSYLCNGMNFADIISLKPQNISGRFLTFYRQKTIRTKKKDLRPIKVGLGERALSIIEKWKNRDASNPYLFPILEANLAVKTVKNRCDRFLKWVNERMYQIAEDLGIETKTSTYAARHTFSTVLKRKGVPISYIKDALGHSSVVTTENYLDSFEDETVLIYADELTSFNHL